MSALLLGPPTELVGLVATGEPAPVTGGEAAAALAIQPPDRRQERMSAVPVELSTTRHFKQPLRGRGGCRPADPT